VFAITWAFFIFFHIIFDIVLSITNYTIYLRRYQHPGRNSIFGHEVTKGTEKMRSEEAEKLGRKEEEIVNGQWYVGYVVCFVFK
jgi:hypothetical protein